MQKAQQEQPQQQQQQWDNKIQNHIWGTCLVQVGKIFKKLFLGGSHVLEFGFGVEFRFVFFFNFLLLGVLSIVGIICGMGFGFGSTLSKIKIQKVSERRSWNATQEKNRKKVKKKTNEA